MFALWFRPERGQPWSVVARASFWSEAIGLIGCGDRHGGDWMPLGAGRHPDQCGCPDWRLTTRRASPTPVLRHDGEPADADPHLVT